MLEFVWTSHNVTFRLECFSQLYVDILLPVRINRRMDFQIVLEDLQEI